MIRASLIFKTVVFTILMALTGIAAQAQKLSNTQKGSLWIEENTDIAENGTVRTNQFQAYNRSTMVNYTVANNKKNLYFFIQSANSAVTNKIINGGIAISINKKDEEKANGCPSVTYPIVRPVDMHNIYEAEYNAKGANQTGLTGNELVMQDSIMASVNKKLMSVIKEIKVLNFKGVTDTLISVYNEYGVKASVKLGNKNILTYTLILPLEALGIGNNTNEFAYNIKLYGPRERPSQTPIEVKGEAPESNGGTINVFRGVGQVNNNEITPKMAEMISMSFTTDFWGKYTLLKSKN